MRKIGLLVVFGLFCGAAILLAQSNDLLDELLSEEKASFGKANYLVLLAAGLIEEDMTVEQSLNFLERQNWGLKRRGENEPITLGEYSYLVMKSLDIPGGLMYRIFPGPRYASRELVYLGIGIEKRDPYGYLSGEEVVGMLGRALDWKEERS
jgi:hypothetical protein